MKAVFNLQPLRNGPAVLRGRNKFDPLGRLDRRSGQTVGQPSDNSDGVHTTVWAEQSRQYNSPVDAITACLFRVCWFWLAEDPNFGGDFLPGKNFHPGGIAPQRPQKLRATGPFAGFPGR